METKKEIRSWLKKQRDLLGVDECHNMSHEIYKRLIALELDREYDNILLYSAIRNEVNTDEYFAYLINKAKRIYYPRVSGNTMSFYPVTKSFTERAFMTDIYRLLQKETLLWQLEWATISSYLTA